MWRKNSFNEITPLFVYCPWSTIGNDPFAKFYEISNNHTIAGASSPKKNITQICFEAI